MMPADDIHVPLYTSSFLTYTYGEWKDWQAAVLLSPYWRWSLRLVAWLNALIRGMTQKMAWRMTQRVARRMTPSS